MCNEVTDFEKIIQIETLRYPEYFREELKQEARIAILEAPKLYKPNKGLNLKSYIINRIKFAMCHYARDRFSLIRIPRTHYEKGVKKLFFDEVEPSHIVASEDFDNKVQVDLVEAYLKKKLNHRDYQIFIAYFKEELTQAELARDFNLSQMQISRVIAKIKKLVQIEFSGE